MHKVLVKLFPCTLYNCSQVKGQLCSHKIWFILTEMVWVHWSLENFTTSLMTQIVRLNYQYASSNRGLLYQTFTQTFSLQNSRYFLLKKWFYENFLVARGFAIVSFVGSVSRDLVSPTLLAIKLCPIVKSSFKVGFDNNNLMTPRILFSNQRTFLSV